MQEVRQIDTSIYGIVEAASEEKKQEALAKVSAINDAARTRKDELVKLGRKLAECVGQETSTNNDNLSAFIARRLEFLKYLRTTFRWETEAIFWNLSVWWRCEIAYQHPESAKKCKI